MCIVGRTNKEWIQIVWYMSTGKDMSARGGALVAAKRACAQWNMRNSESDIIWIYTCPLFEKMNDSEFKLVDVTRTCEHPVCQTKNSETSRLSDFCMITKIVRSSLLGRRKKIGRAHV